ncbi:hypothetical protein EJB05_42545, partial [Eragrostis curvula]
FIQKLRKKVRNRARVEAGIVEAFLIEEATNHLSLYFKSTAPSIKNKMPRYDDGACTFESPCDLEIFQCPGRCISPRGTRELSKQEYKAAFLYILTNIPQMDDFFTKFDKEQWKGRLSPSEQQLHDLRLHGRKNGRGIQSGPNFFDWFRN